MKRNKNIIGLYLAVLILLSACAVQSATPEMPVQEEKAEEKQTQEDFRCGNSANNILGGGLATTDGEWLYYALEDTVQGFSIAKMKPDGSQRTIVTNDQAAFLNVLDEYLYYVSTREDAYNIYRVHITSGEKTLITDDISHYVQVMGQYIYYVNISDENKPYRIKTDGSGKQKLSDRHCTFAVVSDGYVFFVENTVYGIHEFEEMETYDEQIQVNGHLYRIRADGSGETKIKDKWIRWVAVQDKTLWCMDDIGYMYTAPIDAPSASEYASRTFEQIGAFGGGYYYATDEYFDENDIELGRIEQYDLTTEEHRYINEEHFALNMNIVGDYLFFKSHHKGDDVYYMKTDGSDVLPVPGAVSNLVFQNPTQSDPLNKNFAELNITTKELASCVKLFEAGNVAKGAEIRTVFINPKSKCVLRFPAGQYILKIAEGSKWISDELAFGEEGSYISTDPYTFEAGGSYVISSGTRGDFYSESASDFTQ